MWARFSVEMETATFVWKASEYTLAMQYKTPKRLLVEQQPFQKSEHLYARMLRYFAVCPGSHLP
jgi:hypothetical protein